MREPVASADVAGSWLIFLTSLRESSARPVSDRQWMRQPRHEKSSGCPETSTNPVFTVAQPATCEGEMRRNWIGTGSRGRVCARDRSRMAETSEAARLARDRPAAKAAGSAHFLMKKPMRGKRADYVGSAAGRAEGEESSLRSR